MNVNVGEQLRAAVDNSGLSAYEISRRSAVDGKPRISQGQLSRFLRRDRDLTLASVVVLCDVLQLQLVPIVRRRSKPKGVGRG